MTWLAFVLAVYLALGAAFGEMGLRMKKLSAGGYFVAVPLWLPLMAYVALRRLWVRLSSSRRT